MGKKRQAESAINVMDIADWLYENISRTQSGRYFVTFHFADDNQFRWIEGKDRRALAEMCFESIQQGGVSTMWYEHFITGEPILAMMFSEACEGGWDVERALFSDLNNQWQVYAWDSGLCDRHSHSRDLYIVWRRACQDGTEERDAVANARLLAKQAQDELDKTRQQNRNQQQNNNNGRKNRRNRGRNSNSGNAPEPPPWWND